MAAVSGNDLNRRMREVLAETFSDREIARLIAHDAGLDLTHIDLSNAPAVFWQAILEEAGRAGKTETLLEDAYRRAPAITELGEFIEECRARQAAGWQPPAIAPPDASLSTCSSWRSPRGKAAGLAALAFAVLAALAGLYWWRVPAKMTAPFTVAVAEFGSLNTDNKSESSSFEQAVSRMVYERLQAVLPTGSSGNPNPVPGSPEVQVWHDSLGWIRKRTALGVVGGDSPEIRQSSARKMADAVSADVVVYGQLEGEGRDARLWLRIYAPELADSRELLGEQQLGGAIPVSNPARPELGVSYEITSRVEALIFIVKGLNFEFQGQPEQAVDPYMRAAQLPGWHDDQGKEIAHFFIGRAQFRAGNYDQAAAAFEKSLALNPDYARPQLGLGNVALERARRLPAGQLDERLRLVDDALARYARVIAAEGSAEGQEIVVKARLDRCAAYQIQSQAQMDAGHPVEADDALTLMIEEGAQALGEAGRMKASPGQIAELQALAHYDMAVAYHKKGYLWCGQNLAQGSGFYADAQGHFADCAQLAGQRLGDGSSRFVADLNADCSNQDVCTQQCINKLQGGQSACTDDVCLNRCQAPSDGGG